MASGEELIAVIDRAARVILDANCVMRCGVACWWRAGVALSAGQVVCGRNEGSLDLSIPRLGPCIIVKQRGATLIEIDPSNTDLTLICGAGKKGSNRLKLPVLGIKHKKPH